jgi:CDP-diacylglycerol--glycerol-3-phosphate 3-phosphatidyltransferase
MEQQRTTGIIRQLPNALTVARLVMTVLFLGLILYAPATGHPKPAKILMTAFALFVLAGLTDVVDGPIARRFNVTSRFGRVVDPLADKVLVCGSFVCFAIVGQPLLANFHFPEWLGQTIRWGTALLLLGREVVVQTLRHIAESRGVPFGAVISGKIKMFIQSFGIGTVLIGWSFVSRAWGDWFTLITYLIVVGVTLYSGFEALRRPIR